jgi:hypothetical protein
MLGVPTYFLTIAGPDGTASEERCLASWLRELQSSGGKDTRQKRSDGLENATPISGISVNPGLMSTMLLHAVPHVQENSQMNRKNKFALPCRVPNFLVHVFKTHDFAASHPDRNTLYR